MSNRNVEENRDNSDDFTAYKELRRFQINIAKRWLKRANVIEDIFAKFFFCFAGFNALYFLWRKIDKLDKAPEWRHIENLL
ncbi:MAG: hypothetical protein Q7J59_00245, partial [Elusimicrobiota bacterium]|nr:hypothetical protein [Elusimicrobiota bacterium]